MRRVLPALLFPLLLCASLRLGGAVWVRTANYTYDSAGNRIQQIYQATLPEPGNTTNAPYITTNTTYSYIQVGRDNFLTVANLTTGWWKSGSNKLQQVAEYSAFSYDDQGRRQFEDRYDYYDYDTDGGHTGYGTIGGNYSGTYYSYNEPVTVKLHDGVSPVRAYTLTASSTGNTGNLSVPAEDWLRGSDWGGGIGGILYSQVEFGNATTASYYHYDGRGDVVALTSNTGNVTYAAAYNAYGTHAVSLNATTNVTITGTQEVGTDLDPFRTNTREEWDSADGTAFVKEGHRIRGLETDTYNSRDPLGQAAGTNYYTYVLQDEWTKFDPEGLSGTLAICTDADGSTTMGIVTGKHSWLAYKPDEPGKPTFTVSTWGNTHGKQGTEGVNTDTELNNKGYPITQDRTMHLDDNQEAKLNAYIADQKAKGANSYTNTDPCSSFAANGWNTATGEKIDPRNGTSGAGPLGSSTPQLLGAAIKKANGGQNRAQAAPTGSAQAQNESATQQAQQTTNTPSNQPQIPAHDNATPAPQAAAPPQKDTDHKPPPAPAQTGTTTTNTP